ncbi:hypothetical protein ACVV2G_32740 [Streptomyces ziwulingensis]
MVADALDSAGPSVLAGLLAALLLAAWALHRRRARRAARPAQAGAGPCPAE